MVRRPKRRASITDLTDAQWAVLQPLLPPPARTGRPRTVDLREVLNALFYVVRSGCAWRLLPHEFPGGRRCATISTCGPARGSGSASTMRCANRCASMTDGRARPVRPFWTARVSRQPRWGATRLRWGQVGYRTQAFHLGGHAGDASGGRGRERPPECVCRGPAPGALPGRCLSPPAEDLRGPGLAGRRICRRDPTDPGLCRGGRRPPAGPARLRRASQEVDCGAVLRVVRPQPSLEQRLRVCSAVQCDAYVPCFHSSHDQQIGTYLVVSDHALKRTARGQSGESDRRESKWRQTGKKSVLCKHMLHNLLRYMTISWHMQ